MTAEDALAQARERWPGFGAWVAKCSNPRAPYQVGVVVYEGAQPVRRLMGCGLTWERAFLSADRREQISHVPRGSRITRRALRTPPLPQENLFAQGCADEMVRG